MQLRDAQTHREGLEDLGAARARVEDIRLTVEASRVTMMSRRTAHDELRSDGEARVKRIAAVNKDISSWQERLGNAKTRAVELEQVTQGRLLLPPRIEEEVWAGDDDVGAVLVTAIVLNFEGFLTKALMML